MWSLPWIKDIGRQPCSFLFWIKEQIEADGGDAAKFATSEIVQQVDDSLMQLGQEKITNLSNNSLVALGHGAPSAELPRQSSAKSLLCLAMAVTPQRGGTSRPVRSSSGTSLCRSPPSRTSSTPNIDLGGRKVIRRSSKCSTRALTPSRAHQSGRWGSPCFYSRERLFW